ncbi:hypothetical protein C0V75_04725 [Tabrizicola sp. TH137]|uniref:COG4223 family protein n=1 Tax=Tabrizicola sp. TH137 TaxID=2067452 RepID=UPI000C7AC9D3|nr:hypothetical protein [Tabrizicola sp. TH137]PLL14722.1 hypothetical protein C0V75_04725 [Tabrizicola sp. TH137]
MARRKNDESTPAEEGDLMAVVEATDPQAIDSAPPVPPELPPATEPTAQPHPTRAPGGGGAGAFLAMVLGGAIAAGAGFGLARLMPDLLPLGTDNTLAATVAAQAEELAALREQLAALPAKPAPDPGLESRITALEAAAAPDLSTLDTRLATLESQVAALPVASGNGISADPALRAELAALKEQVATLGTGGTVPADVIAAAEAAENRLKEAETRAAALAEQATKAAAEARRTAALDRIAAAFDSGAPFAAAAADLGPALPADLADHAATGLPTLRELQDSFEDAARRALEDALRANMGETWTDRVSNFLRSQTGLRSLTPRDGDDPDAVLSRAEAALGAGRLADALAELDALPEAGKPALADWAAQARIRTAAEDALAQLQAQ